MKHFLGTCNRIELVIVLLGALVHLYLFYWVLIVCIIEHDCFQFKNLMQHLLVFRILIPIKNSDCEVESIFFFKNKAIVFIKVVEDFRLCEYGAVVAIEHNYLRHCKDQRQE